MKTVNEICVKVFGHKCWQSVSYSESRTILKYLDDEKAVIGYAYGLFGFVVLIKTVSKSIKGYLYCHRNPFNKWGAGGFSDIGRETVIGIIKNSPLVIEKYLKEKELKEEKCRYQRPVLLEIATMRQYCGTSNFRLVRNKSGKIRVEIRSYGEKYICYYSRQSFVGLIKENKVKLTADEEKVIEELKSQILVEQI